MQECQKLAGISVGGWITVSALAGMLLGAALTLAIQWYRRRKQLRYMDAVSAKQAVHLVNNSVAHAFCSQQ